MRSFLLFSLSLLLTSTLFSQKLATLPDEADELFSLQQEEEHMLAQRLAAVAQKSNDSHLLLLEQWSAEVNPSPEELAEQSAVLGARLEDIENELAALNQKLSQLLLDEAESANPEEPQTEQVLAFKLEKNLLRQRIQLALEARELTLDNLLAVSDEALASGVADTQTASKPDSGVAVNP